MGAVRARRAPQLNVTITQEHIDSAIPADSSHCMIADAVRDAMPNAEYISVDLATIRFTDRLAGRRYIYLTPDVAQQALIAFDQGERVEPFAIKARAAQMIATGAARKAKRIQEEDEAAAAGLPKPKRKRPGPQITRSAEGLGPTSVGVKEGGDLPPIAPLAGGAGGVAVRKGRRRQFGIRALLK